MNLKPIVFEELPVHDTCWSLITGADGKVYIGVCGEMTGGMSAYVVSYDPETEKVEYLLEVAEVLGILPNNGEATHAKVHFCLLSDDEGILYAATHCTGPPSGDVIWRPWNCWSHPVKHFRGSGIFGYDPKKKEVLFTDLFLPHEGSRCMAISCKRRKIYGISYPRNHFFIYDLNKHEVRDLGRIGCVNSLAIFLDADENAYTTDEYGYLIRCDGDKEELEEMGIQIPHPSFQNGFHNVLHDAVASPDSKDVYIVLQNFGGELFRYNFKKNKIQDLGKACGEEITEWSPTSHIIDDNVGGLVFGLDGYLYFAANLHEEKFNGPYLIRLNPENLERENLGQIAYQGKAADHISRASRDFRGDLYFAEVGNRPTKIFKYQPEGIKENKLYPSEGEIRYWG
ncbi:hypothetical protein KAW50_08065 [candidate division WOR-3 bacterium]|nr:hypothetical protein [candidate division WOR-3 bacterium]